MCTHQVCDFLIFEEEAQLSKQLEVAKNVLAVHELEALLEVHTGLHVQVLIVREEPSLMTFLDHLQVSSILIYGRLLNELHDALNDFFSVKIVVHRLEPLK